MLYRGVIPGSVTQDWNVKSSSPKCSASTKSTTYLMFYDTVLTRCPGISTMTPGALWYKLLISDRHAMSFFVGFLRTRLATSFNYSSLKLGRKLSWHFHFASALGPNICMEYKTDIMIPNHPKSIVLWKYIEKYLRVLDGTYVYHIVSYSLFI